MKVALSVLYWLVCGRTFESCASSTLLEEMVAGIFLCREVLDFIKSFLILCLFYFIFLNSVPFSVVEN